ncbi:PEP-CTERM sorting domain-containing protein [Kamptonema formosum]|uniref:PEP-CTERM sorting domain-containing protein n=1 Tax=Kamptonema formosum TaxID=331992 RepID=UPI00034CD003|nr:PEP-CTERM sorting domain-containing protein [Oscillatoria sp. PCC 10802]
MKTKLVASLTAAAAASAVACFSTPALAASLTPSNFGVNGIKFDTNTTVQFDFLESHGMWQTALGVYRTDGTLAGTLFTEDLRGSDPGANDSKNDWKGTCGLSMSNCTTTFNFLAGVEYKLGLRKYNPATPNVVSAPYSLGSDANKAKFIYGGSYTYNLQGPTWIQNNPGQSPQTASLSVGFEQVLIAMEDGYDKDYNDFIFKGKKVPEPSTALALLGVGAAGLLGVRRRRHREIG